MTYDARLRRLGRPADQPCRDPGGEAREPSPLDDFLTARWGAHVRRGRRTTYVPNQHERWTLRDAELVELDDGSSPPSACPGSPTGRRTTWRSAKGSTQSSPDRESGAVTDHRGAAPARGAGARPALAGLARTTAGPAAGAGRGARRAAGHRAAGRAAGPGGRDRAPGHRAGAGADRDAVGPVLRLRHRRDASRGAGCGLVGQRLGPERRPGPPHACCHGHRAGGERLAARPARAPRRAAVGYVTGGTMANFTCLAAGRDEVLRRVGWDLAAHGLQSAAGARARRRRAARHDRPDASLPRARCARDGRGRRRGPARPRRARCRARGADGPTIVCLQAGNVHSGAFDPFAEAIEVAHRHGAWVHVDGAFGLFAAAARPTATS